MKTDAREEKNVVVSVITNRKGNQIGHFIWMFTSSGTVRTGEWKDLKGKERYTCDYGKRQINRN